MMRLSIALCALTFLSACGLRGPLEVPPPLWGEERARYEAEQARIAAEEAARQAAEEAETDDDPE